jgi:hypothetical protein
MSFDLKSPLPVALFSACGERVRARGSNRRDACNSLLSTHMPIGSGASKIDQSKRLPLTLTLSPLRTAMGRGDMALSPHGAAS